MNPILTNEEVGILTVFDGLHHIETPLLADYIRAIEDDHVAHLRQGVEAAD